MYPSFVRLSMRCFEVKRWISWVLRYLLLGSCGIYGFICASLVLNNRVGDEPRYFERLLYLPGATGAIIAFLLGVLAIALLGIIILFTLCPFLVVFASPRLLSGEQQKRHGLDTVPKRVVEGYRMSLLILLGIFGYFP